MATETTAPPRDLAEAQTKLRHPLDRLRSYIRLYIGLEGSALVVLFPQTPEHGTPRPVPGHADAARSAGRRAACAAIEVAAVCIGTMVLLLRIPRIPAWDTLYAEDQGVYLFDALAHPWHLLVPYGGYEELVPRLVGQLISYLPLADAAVPFALTGAGIAALCALFIYHAMDGWIRSSWLRALDAVEALEADTIIAGHRDPQATDDDAQRQIGECRRYIADFEAALERSAAPAELIDRMTTAYPSLANPYTLWVAAFDLLGNRS